MDNFDSGKSERTILSTLMNCLVLIIQERENASSQAKAKTTFPLARETVVQFEEMKRQPMNLSRILWIPTQFKSEKKGKSCEKDLYSYGF